MAIEDAKPEHRPPGLEGPHVRPEGDTAQRTWQARTDVCTTPASAPDGYPSGDHGRGHGVARSGAQAYYGCGKNQHDDRPAAYNTAAAAESLRHLACEIIQLCDANPTGAVLCANLPRQYKKRFRKVLDFKQYGFLKMSALLAKLPGIHFEGTHRAEVSHRAANAAALFDVPSRPLRLSKLGACGTPRSSDNIIESLPPLNHVPPPPPPSPPHAAYSSADAPSWKAIVAGEAAVPRSADSFDTDDEQDPTDSFSV